MPGILQIPADSRGPGFSFSTLSKSSHEHPIQAIHGFLEHFLGARERNPQIARCAERRSRDASHIRLIDQLLRQGGVVGEAEAPHCVLHSGKGIKGPFAWSALHARDFIQRRQYIVVAAPVGGAHLGNRALIALQRGLSRRL